MNQGCHDLLWAQVLGKTFLLFDVTQLPSRRIITQLTLVLQRQQELVRHNTCQMLLFLTNHLGAGIWPSRKMPAAHLNTWTQHQAQSDSTSPQTQTLGSNKAAQWLGSCRFCTIPGLTSQLSASAQASSSCCRHIPVNAQTQVLFFCLENNFLKLTQKELLCTCLSKKYN